MTNMTNDPWNQPTEWQGTPITPFGDATPPRIQQSGLSQPPTFPPVPPPPSPRTVVYKATPKQKEEVVFAWVIMLEGKHAGQAIQLQPQETLLGRDSKRVHIMIQDDTVSGMHAKILRRRDEEGYIHYRLYDLASSNGTWIEDEDVFDYPLEDGIKFDLGRAKLAFKRL